MNIRWRLGVTAIQLIILLVATFLVTGRLVVPETWLLAGLLAIVINPQLLEPWYPKPQDVLANTVIAGALAAISPRAVTGPGWLVLGAILSGFFVAALLALALGAAREEGVGVSVGRAAAGVSRVASGLVIYSCVFWISLVEYRPAFDNDFWTLGAAWAGVVLFGRVNWQAAWATMTGAPLPCTPEGMIGPSMLLITTGRGVCRTVAPQSCVANANREHRVHVPEQPQDATARWGLPSDGPSRQATFATVGSARWAIQSSGCRARRSPL